MSVTEYGLIGHPVAHSLSPFIHRELFEAAGLQGVYKLHDITPQALAQRLPPLLDSLAGINCTIPHKEAVLPFLRRLDASAKICRSVNTIRDKVGYNTDHHGFLQACPSLEGHRVLILGAGGVSRTMAYAAAPNALEIHILARRPEQARALKQDLEKQWPQAKVFAAQDEAEIDAAFGPEPAGARPPCALLNGTPLGLWPKTRDLPFPREKLKRFSFVFDSIYNPVSTRLVLAARSQDVPAYGGLEMLFSQALAAQKIWNPQAIFREADCRQIMGKMALAVFRQSPVSILLTGFMGSGKTTIGALLAQALDLPFVDLDKAIETEAGQTIPEIFARQGEKVFREKERRLLGKCLQAGKAQVLSTGGGALTSVAAETLLQQHPCQVIHLDVPLITALRRVGDGQGRPLAANQHPEKLRELHAHRRPLYERVADFSVSSEDAPQRVIETIIRYLGLGG